MRRYIVLLLITGIVWAQTDFDKLVLKDGTTYLGEYSRTDQKVIYFKRLDSFAFQPLPTNIVKVLQLKDGTFVINNGIINNNFLRSKMSTSGKAVFDAKKDAKKWIAYPLLAGLTFASSTYGTMIIAREEPWESLPAMIGISIASLAVPYKVLNDLEKYQIEQLRDEYYIELYKETLSEEFIKNNIIGLGLLGLAAAGGYIYFISTFTWDDDFYFGP